MMNVPFLNLTAQYASLKAELLPLEERIRIVGITLKAWIRGQVIISVEIKSAAVSVVAARSGDNVDRAIARQAGRKVHVDG